MKGIFTLQHKSIVHLYSKYDMQVYSHEGWHAGSKEKWSLFFITRKNNEILWQIQWYMVSIGACLSLVLHAAISQLSSALWRVIPPFGLDWKLKYKLIKCFVGKDEVESDVPLRYTVHFSLSYVCCERYSSTLEALWVKAAIALYCHELYKPKVCLSL